MTLAELLAEIVRALDATGIPHMVAGSLASTHHGEPRSTLCHWAEILGLTDHLQAAMNAGSV